jgi:ABC-2 type transport system permease protein
MKEKLRRQVAKYRYSTILLRQLVITDFKLRYKGSVLGYVWTLLRPLALPRYVVVLAGSLSALINLSINLVVVLLFMILNGVNFHWEALLVIPLIIELFVLGLGVAFLLSALYVRFRDINYIWEVILQAGFYATPILYPIDLVIKVAPGVAKAMMLNPMAQIIQDVRYFVVTDSTVTLGILYKSVWVYAVPLCIVLLLALLASVYFKKRSPYFAEEV